MKKKVTSVTALQSGVGIRLSPTYSVIDDNGIIIKPNERFNLVVMDDNEDMLAHIDAIMKFAETKIPE